MAVIDPEALSSEKRGQILQGAAVVFMQDGYEGASMSRIAREANVSKGTLYNHFQGKAELFAAHMQQACATYLGHIFEQLDSGDALEPALHEIGRRVVAMMLTPERRAIYRMAIAEAESFPEMAQSFYQAGPRVAIGMLSRWIKAQVAAGRLHTDDPEFAAEQFFALCQTQLWFRYRLHLRDQPTEAEIGYVVAGAVRMFLACYAIPA